MTRLLLLAIAALVGVVAVARATRLVTSDAYPPMAWLRDHWTARMDRGSTYSWAPLLTCPFCFAPYAAAVDLAWLLAAGVEWDGLGSKAWWLVNLWAAGSYAASMIVVRDEPEPVDE